MLDWMKFLLGFFYGLPSWNQAALVVTGLAFGGVFFISVVNYARRQGAAETQIEIPKESVRVVVNEENCWWHMGGISGKPAMQVSLDGFVTNVSKYGTIVLQARFVYGGGSTRRGFLLVQNPSGVDFGMYMIPTGSTRQFSGLFWVQPPVAKEGEPFEGDLELTDQFNNVMPVGRIKLKYR